LIRGSSVHNLTAGKIQKHLFNLPVVEKKKMHPTTDATVDKGLQSLRLLIVSARYIILNMEFQSIRLLIHSQKAL
jgi:hypothetical protein